VLGTSLLWRSTVPFTYFKLNPPSAFVYFRWSRSWSCYFGLGLKNVILFTLLYLPQLNIIVHLLVTELMLASEGDMCMCLWQQGLCGCVNGCCVERVDSTVKIESSTVDIEERGVKLRLTVVDTPGFSDAVNSNDWYYMHWTPLSLSLSLSLSPLSCCRFFSPL